MKNTTLRVENRDTLGALRQFLAQLLETGFVNALLVPRAMPSGDGFVQALVKDPAALEDVNPLAPTIAVQSAKILSELTSQPVDGRIAAVLKPCELRAAVELTKFLQVKLDNVVTIGVDCLGTVEVKDYAQMLEPDRAATVQAMIDGGNDSVRNACRICENPAPVGADITVALLGGTPSSEIPVLVEDRLADELAEKISPELKDGDPDGRQSTVDRFVAQRKEARVKALQELKERTDSMEKLMAVLSTCIRCHNCMDACPICYCRECVFLSALFEPKPSHLLRKVERKGAIRMPGDTLIFHLTRMAHMASSCVSCGMCESACPNDLPISALFSSMGDELQDMFEYVPGRDAEEEPPVSVFREDELKAETGTQ